MRPVLLKMTAFGPYKYTEVIDFNELEQNDLFVISGNTGAGKTTIFDGICFALYGSASGSDRENQMMLRSDFAEDDTHTAVELIFELAGNQYRILRQLGHVKRGNRTKTGDKVEFYQLLDDGREIPCVDRQIVSEIDKRVESLLGLTQDQFKQIVMLPQGEFRKLLTSQTENKEDILRRLFKTESYKQIGERLRQRRKQAEESFTQERQLRDTYIHNISATLPARDESLIFQILAESHFNTNQIIEGLAQEAAFYDEKSKVDKKTYDAAYQTHQQKQAEYLQAKAINDRFTELEQKQRQQQELEGQLPLFTEKEKQFEQAERASALEPYEKQLLDCRQDVDNKTKAMHEADLKKKQASDAYEKAEIAFKLEESKIEERENWNKQLTRLQSFLPIVQEMDERKNHLTQLKQAAMQTQGQLKEMEATVEQLEKETLAIKEQMNKLDEAVSTLPDKEKQRAEMREQWRVLEEYIRLSSEQNKLSEDVKRKKQRFETERAAYSEREQKWLSHQASMLASHLHDGEACPVCGSIDHPQKAASNEDGVTKEQLDAMKKVLDEVDGQYRDALAQFNTNARQLELKKNEVTQFGFALGEVVTLKARLEQEGKILKADIEKLEANRKKLAEVKTAAEQLQSKFKSAELKRSELERSLHQQTSKYDSARAVYLDRIKDIPEEIRVLTELEKKIAETERIIRQLEKDWQAAQKNMQTAKDEQTKAIANAEHALQLLREVTSKKEQAEQQFTDVLTQSEFETEAAYRQAKRPLEERQSLKRDIEQFKQSLATVRQQVSELHETLKDKEKVDVTALEQVMVDLKQAYELAWQEWNQSQKLEAEARKLIDRIEEADERVRKYEQQFAMIDDLYNVIRGQNSQKISFERYLQMEYLEQIIDAANQRLRPLSNGQFHLMRSDRQESHGRQSGLALDVYDSYTGQTRDVKTLSGGEKFNASLCLALGMSDVVQSFQGNISIKTMFIDEGFGSLDEESLNKSIDTLVDLQQSGRMIGVISHVQELKSIFPAVLEVKKTKEGFSKTKFVIK